jgi:hypothetical protein
MSQTTPPAAAVSRLPVLTIVRHANTIALGQPGVLARAATLPFLLSMAIAALTVTTPAFPLISVFLAVAGLAPYAIFGVAWCRFVLYGPDAGRPPLFPFWARAHWRYFGYLAALAFIAFGLVVPPLLLVTFQAVVAADAADSASALLIFTLGELAVILAVAVLMVRLSFVFPAAAADEIYTWRHSWAHTRGQGLRLLAAIALSVAPAIAVLWVVSSIFGIFSFPEIDPAVVREATSPDQVIGDYLAANAGRLAVAQVAMTAMSYLVLGVALAAIALAFRIGTGWVPPAAPLAPPSAPV